MPQVPRASIALAPRRQRRARRWRASRGLDNRMRGSDVPRCAVARCARRGGPSAGRLAQRRELACSPSTRWRDRRRRRRRVVRRATDRPRLARARPDRARRRDGARAGRLDTGRPKHCARHETLGAQRNTVGIDAGDVATRANLDPRPFELRARPLAQFGRVGWQHATSALDQNDARALRVNVPKLAPQGAICNLRKHAREFDAGRTGADDAKREPGQAPSCDGARSAFSNASRMRRRISSASSRVLRPGAKGAQSS